ncbi:MAG TPA: ROK family protein [Candidatus Sulfotelmatobacter sp.]|jgi:predicted NBD/HSP70 family sugar kinase|nr:ROK family protein [Candidatus Sulfotelmatobacter sp.]
MILHPARMGQHNKRALVRQLQKLGMASRADLAKSLGMSQPTAGKIVDELLAVKILEEVEIAGNGDHGSARLGRPGRQLQLNRSRSGFLGIHLGIRETFLAEIPLGSDDEDCWRVSFRNPTARTGAAAAWEKELGAAANKLKSKNFLGVLVSVPGLVDEGTNRILFSPNIHWSEEADLAAIVRRIWDTPVLLVQEERAVALGYHFNHPDVENFLLVDFGEGVGGAVIVGGKPFASPLPVSGELGHTPVIGNRRRCGCGATGCMETLVSIRGLLESFAAAHPGKKSNWETLRRHVEEHGIEPWLAQTLDAAAVAITAALNVLGLRHVVVTGSLTELPAGVLAHLSRAVQDGALWARFGEVDCVAAPRRRAAGLVAIGIDRLVVPEMSN